MPHHSIAAASIQERPPLVVGVVRGKETESTHAIHAVIARDDGSLVASHGDPQRQTFPRSAVKSIQALALLESGAADRFGFTPSELALACSSHAGTPLHVETARSMLDKAGFEPGSLECGAHWPLEEASARALARVADEPSPLHNNCSGKHAGFLAVARHLGPDPAGYVAPDHPVQKRVTATLAEVCGVPLSAANRATDGCSIPTYKIPLASLATGFARIGTGASLPAARQAAFERLRRAVAENPLLIAGPGRFDSRVTATCGPRVFLKSGAEGVLCAAIPEAGLGIALKAEDGALRGSEVAMAELLLKLLPAPTPEERALLDELRLPHLKNWAGTNVGHLGVTVASIR
jgi:L-asparaginase II